MTEYAYIDRLRQAMEGSYSRDYIDKCAEYARNLLDKKLPVIYDARQVREILRLEQIQADCYHTFVINGKHKEREITAPSRGIKQRQQWILEEILEKQDISNNCHGFVKNRSILTNARMHMGHKNILNLDIQDFFPSVTQDMVKSLFQQTGYGESAAEALAKICCYEGKLPQGAPTSPYISNLILKNMDQELENFCQKKDITYTRYADDMSFSSNQEIYGHLKDIRAVIQRYSFQINEKKTCYYQDPHRKIVTGLVVKETEVCVPKKFKRKLRQEIYYCRQLGVQKHLDNTGNSNCVGFKEYMYGKAYFVAMVEPETGEKYLKELDEIEWGYH